MEDGDVLSRCIGKVKVKAYVKTSNSCKFSMESLENSRAEN